MDTPQSGLILNASHLTEPSYKEGTVEEGPVFGHYGPRRAFRLKYGGLPKSKRLWDRKRNKKLLQQPDAL